MQAPSLALRTPAECGAGRRANVAERMRQANAELGPTLSWGETTVHSDAKAIGSRQEQGRDRVKR
jgi:hypothetical protein